MRASAVRVKTLIREFRCHSTQAHIFKCLVRTRQITDPFSEEISYQLLGTAAYAPIPICPQCGHSADRLEFYDPQLAAVPESDRFVAWLSPDGKQLSVPGNNSAAMPERYKLAGYIRVEAHSIRDIDRLDSIRARQTGNTVANEINYDPESRKHRDSVDLVDADPEPPEIDESALDPIEGFDELP